MKFRSTIQRKTSVFDRSGQEVVEWKDFETNKKCLFLATSGNKNTVAKEQFGAVVAFYMEPNSGIEEGDRVINIRTVTGAVVEPGPFEVISVKRVPNHLSGHLHHISCKLSGAA